MKVASRDLLSLFTVGAIGGLTDGQLLERFAALRHEEAFEALVRRHGPMVWGVCRRVLRDPHDAEDAFQATFLVLARKAASIAQGEKVAGWIYAVAYRTAVRARAMASRRRARERQLAEMPEPESRAEGLREDLLPLLDRELGRLPEKYRAPILLCDLEGKTQKEAACLLGWPVGTVSGRLSRARAMLAQRLARRGVSLSVGALAAVLSHDAASAGAPNAVVTSTVEAATQYVAGRAAAAGVISPRVAVLAEGVLKAMLMSKLKATIVVVLILGFAATGAKVLVTRTATAQDGPPVVEEGVESPPKQKPEGVKAGLAEDAKPGDDAARPGDLRAGLEAGGLGPIMPASAGPPRAARADFDEVTLTYRPPGPGQGHGLPATVRVTAAGECVYRVEGRPAAGTSPAWGPAAIVHQLPPDRLRRLAGLLEATGWATKPVAKGPPALHQPGYTVSVKRGGTAAVVTCEGEPEPYADLLAFFQSVIRQENLLYRLERVPAAAVEARRELDGHVRAELGGPHEKPPFEIDYARFVPWTTRLVRAPFGKPDEDVATAVRFVGMLRLEAEREAVADLANDRESRVRAAVAEATGRLGGERAIPVLRKMLRSTTEAPWELIKLGPAAVPTIAAVIREETDPQRRDYEWLIRAYVDHWAEVPKPVPSEVLDAVRASMAVPEVKADRTEYHQQLLKLAEGM